MIETRGRDRSEARTLGKGTRALIGFVLTVLLVATQAQFVAGAKPADKEKKGGPAAESTAPAPEESPAPEAPAAEEPPPAEEPPADEAPPADEPADEPAPDPSEPPADGGGGSSGGGDTGDGTSGDTGDGTSGGGDETGTEPDAGTEAGGPDGSASEDAFGTSPSLDRASADVGVLDQGEPPPDVNPDCADFGLLELTRFQQVPGSGSVTQDGVTITITDSEEGEATEFSWTSETPIDLVIVKAGPGASLYFYDEKTSDSGLSGPDDKGISHITFCYDVEEDRFFNEVVKVWLDEQGEETDPPELSEGFSITIEGEGDNTGSLTCTVEEGSLSCEGDLEIHDPDDGVTVTETNPPDGWEVGDISIQCTTEENETGGTDTSCVIRIENVMQEVPEDRYSLEVTKIWLDEEGQEVDPPEDLPEGFAVIIEGQGENDGSLTCSYDESGAFGCEGDLVVEDGEEVSVSEENAPPGWEGPDSATADCEETENETGGTDTSCVIEVVNSFRPEDRFSLEVTKLWLDEEGNLSDTPPEDLPEGFAVILSGRGENDGSLTCSYDGSELECAGNLVVEDGEVVDVSEENAPEGWAAPDQATADCEESPNETGGMDTVCTISVTNIAEEVLGEQIIVSKAWLDLEGNLSATPPEGTPDTFEIVITDGEGSLTCSYQEGRLACTGELEVEDGERLDIIETDVPENWAGPEHARAQCVTDEETQSTTCIVAIRNIEQQVLPGPPVRPPARPSPEVLAVTGAELALMGLVALALVLAGIALSYLGRREDETGA